MVYMRIIKYICYFIFYILCILFLYTLFAYPTDIFLATKTGLLLWYNNILPSLFAFIIIINIIIETNLVHLFSFVLKPLSRVLNVSIHGSICFALGLLTGYPLGAKTVYTMLSNGEITEDEANILITYSNNCGPMFIIGAIAINMFGDLKIGTLLIVSQMFAAISIALYQSFQNRKKRYAESPFGFLPKSNISVILNDSIMSAVETIINIGGVVVFFCILIKVFGIYHIQDILYLFVSKLCPVVIPATYFSNMIFGIIEITNGLYLLSILQMDLLYKILSASFLISFGGFCVHMQTHNIILHSNIKFGQYLKYKFVQGVLSVLFTFFLYHCFF